LGVYYNYDFYRYWVSLYSGLEQSCSFVGKTKSKGSKNKKINFSEAYAFACIFGFFGYTMMMVPGPKQTTLALIACIVSGASGMFLTNSNFLYQVFIAIFIIFNFFCPCKAIAWITMNFELACEEKRFTRI
jgi:hypothetical protein